MIRERVAGHASVLGHNMHTFIHKIKKKVQFNSASDEDIHISKQLPGYGKQIISFLT